MHASRRRLRRLGYGRIQLEFTAYSASQLPPRQYVTSVRCLLLQNHMLLVQRDLDGEHILPGGRCEPGEELEQTLRREVLEETGWMVERPQLLGCIHFHHLTPRPLDYAYPYPDFAQVVFVAEAAALRAEAMQPDVYVVDSTFRPIREALQMSALPVGQKLLLQRALELRCRHA